MLIQYGNGDTNENRYLLEMCRKYIYAYINAKNRQTHLQMILTVILIQPQYITKIIWKLTH